MSWARHPTNQQAAPGFQWLEHFLLSAHPGSSTLSACLFPLRDCGSSAATTAHVTGTTAALHAAHQLGSSLSTPSLKSGTVQFLFHMHQCVQGNGTYPAPVLAYHRAMRLISLPYIFSLWKWRGGGMRGREKNYFQLSVWYMGSEENVDGGYKRPENMELWSKPLFLGELVAQNQSCGIPALDKSGQVDTTARTCRERSFFYQQMEINRCWNQLLS